MARRSPEKKSRSEINHQRVLSLFEMMEREAKQYGVDTDYEPAKLLEPLDIEPVQIKAFFGMTTDAGDIRWVVDHDSIKTKLSKHNSQRYREFIVETEPKLSKFFEDFDKQYNFNDDQYQPLLTSYACRLTLADAFLDGALINAVARKEQLDQTVPHEIILGLTFASQERFKRDYRQGMRNRNPRNIYETNMAKEPFK